MVSTPPGEEMKGEEHRYTIQTIVSTREHEHNRTSTSRKVYLVCTCGWHCDVPEGTAEDISFRLQEHKINVMSQLLGFSFVGERLPTKYEVHEVRDVEKTNTKGET